MGQAQATKRAELGLEMGAEIIEFASARQRLRPEPVHEQEVVQQTRSRDQFHFWTGASGQRYVHTVHGLRECPEIPDATFILLHRAENGTVSVRQIGRVAKGTGSLNLAEIRHLGARFGANEVHVHLLAQNAKQASLIIYDLHCAIFGEPLPTSPCQH